MALNFNPLATLDDSSCIYARPINTIIDSIPGDAPEIVDTLGTSPQEDCTFDYSTAVDSVLVMNVDELQNGDLNVDWSIWQSGDSTMLTSTYNTDTTGGLVLFQSIICNQGITTTKDLGDENVKAITISAVINQTVLGIEQHKAFKNEALKLYPLPAHDEVIISFPQIDENDRITIIIYTIDGVMVKEVTNLYASEKGEINMNVNSLVKGIYYVTVKSESYVYPSLKVIKD